MNAIVVQEHRAPDTIDGVTAITAAPANTGELNDRLMRVVSAAKSNVDTADLANRKTRWQRSYRAFRNQHVQNSKYLSKAYRARSKYFVPKTRSSVRKNMTAAATALFSTKDAVSVTSENADDELQEARGKVLDKLLNYRLDRSSRKAGVPWFLLTMGANQDAQLTGICLSKQYWQYEEVPGQAGEAEADQFDDAAAEAMNGFGMQTDQIDGMDAFNGKPEPKILRDRPYAELCPPENAIIDNAAPWVDPIQEGRFFTMMYPMHVSDVEELMESGRQHMGGGAWHKIENIGAGESSYTQESVRRARQGGADTQDRTNQPNADGMDIVWAFENFVRIDGTDYHWWSLGTKDFLTDPRPTEESYPALKGQRPYARGYGAIESHNTHPMSPVESWQPLQQEANDVRNLRLDTVKQAISPITKVKRGANVDTAQLKHRGPDAMIYMNSMDDVEFDRSPDATQGAFTESNFINADFDEISGTFSATSVQTNRQFNETVGGMKLLSGSANAVTEFDLRLWVETWVEPVLRQIVMMEQYYETDEVLLSLAGQAASEAYKQFGYDPMLDDLAEAEVVTRVDVGIGATDPMQRLSKLGSAIEMAIPVFQASEGQVKLKPKGMLGEIFGLAGYKDIDRLFEFEEDNEEGQQEQPTPEEMAEMAKQKNEQAKIEQGNRKIEQAREKAQLDNQTKIKVQAMGDDTDIQVAKMRNYGDAIREMQNRRADKERDDSRNQIDARNNALNAAVKMKQINKPVPRTSNAK